MKAPVYPLTILVAPLALRPPLSPDLPDSLRRLIKSCWDADPMQRPAMSLVRTDLGQIMVSASTLCE